MWLVSRGVFVLEATDVCQPTSKYQISGPPCVLFPNTSIHNKTLLILYLINIQNFALVAKT